MLPSSSSSPPCLLDSFFLLFFLSRSLSPSLSPSLFPVRVFFTFERWPNMNKKKAKRTQWKGALTRAAIKHSVKATANFARRNGCVCSYIHKCRIRRKRQWLTCYDQFSEYEQNHTSSQLCNDSLYDCLSVWCWLLRLCTVLLSSFTDE